MKKATILILTIIIIFLNYLPIKMSVKREKLLNTGDDVVMVKAQKVTGFDWYIVDDDEYVEDVVLLGNTPKWGEFSSINMGYNTFVCFGEYKDDTYFDNNMYKVFEVKEWKILYPIKRNGMRPEIMNPKYAINIFDYID